MEIEILLNLALQWHVIGRSDVIWATNKNNHLCLLFVNIQVIRSNIASFHFDCPSCGLRPEHMEQTVTTKFAWWKSSTLGHCMFVELKYMERRHAARRRWVAFSGLTEPTIPQTQQDARLPCDGFVRSGPHQSSNNLSFLYFSLLLSPLS